MPTQIPFSLEFSENAQKALVRLDKSIAKRLIAALAQMAQDPRSYRHRALRGQLAGLYKLRVGNNREIYRLDLFSRVVVVEKVGHRRDIYRLP